MFKDFVLFVKYPYTAGIIATMWLGTAALLAIDNKLPVIAIVAVNMAASIVIAVFGFRGQKEI
jgi:hypothetical protein